MHLPRISLLLLLSVMLTPWFGFWGLGPAAVARACSARNDEKQRDCGASVTLSIGRVAVALGREHAAALYHLSANAVRYYSLPLLVIGGIQPSGLPPFSCCSSSRRWPITGGLRPQLSLLVFIGLYGLELVAYPWDSGAAVGNGAPASCCRA